MIAPTPSSAISPATRVSPARCAYCDAPLPANPPASVSHEASPRYCCYGCRILGERHAHPLDSTRFAPGSPWFKIVLGAALAGQSMLLGMAINLSPPAGPARGWLHGALIFTTLCVLGLLGPPLLKAALEELRHRRMAIELLFLAGIAGALGVSLRGTFSGGGPVYYEVVGVLMAVYATGKTLGAQSRARALVEAQALRRLFETCARIEPDGALTTIPVTQIAVGDRVHVRIGEPIPIDGRILTGQAFVCETPLTGEPFPVARRPGDTVLAGSYAEDGELKITATAPGAKRRLDTLLAALDSARERPCRIQAQADRLARWFLPLVLTASGATFAGWTWTTSLSAGIYNALSVLLVACPCALGLATPLALWSGLSALASRGLVPRGGDEIERLAAVNEVVFDKTGTLSEDRYSLVDLATLGASQDRSAIVSQLHAVQNASTHPVARAFHTPPPAGGPNYQVRDFKTVPALGVEAWLESSRGEEHHLRVGQRELMASHVGERELLAQLAPAASGQRVYVEIDGQLRAIAAVSERLRGSTRETLAALKTLGISCRVLTGDKSANAAHLLGQLAVEGGLSPEAKAARIKDLTNRGRRVGFVGDGVNDAPAMRAANVSLALAHGAGVTTANADAILHGGDLRVIPWAIALCRQVRASIHSNLAFAAAYNLGGMVLAAAGLLHPVAAALLMAISSFTVSWRALRATENACICGAQPTAMDSPPTAPLIRQLGWFDTPRAKLRRALSAGLGATSGRCAALLTVAQIPLLIYWGQMNGTGAIMTTSTLLAAAWWMIRYNPLQPAQLAYDHWIRMAFAMLGWGNGGMLLGWWADSGFGPFQACCLTAAGLDYDFWSFLSMPWMNAGMLLFGLPPMLTGPAKNYRGVGRFGYGLLAAAGMIWGMALGGHALLKWLGPWTTQKAFLAFIGMTIGMLGGMFLFCEFGRAIALWARSFARGNRSSKH
jgi:P-type Cu+ transporter